MKNRIIALAALALTACAGGSTDEAADRKPDDPAVSGGETALEPPSAMWDARDPGLAPPDDPALPF